MSAIS